VQQKENDVSPCPTVKAEGWQLKIPIFLFSLQAEHEKLLVKNECKPAK